MMSFRLTGLSAEQFRPLFSLDANERRRRGIETRITETGSDDPCRVSLEVAKPGETVILLSYDHQPEHSPYQGSGPIFVREAAVETFNRQDQIPDQVRPRLMAVRAYDTRHYIAAADVSPGHELEALIGPSLPIFTSTMRVGIASSAGSTAHSTRDHPKAI